MTVWPTFCTGRLTLRPAKDSDLDALHAIFADPRAMRYWSGPPHDSLAQTRAFLDRFIAAGAETREEYILDLGGRCIGKAGMWRLPEVGFILHPDHWGRGYAQEAMAAILPRIFARFPQIEALTAEIDPRNAASAALLRRLGFTLVRIGRGDFLYGGTVPCDTGYFRLPRPP